MRFPVQRCTHRSVWSVIPLTFIIVGGFASTAIAHEFWIEPSTYHAASSELIFVRLKAGEHFDGRSQPRSPRNINSFSVRHGETAQDINGKPGDEPAGYVLLQESGWYVLSYRSHPSKIILDANRFETYLKEEGLESIIKLRADRQQSAKSGRERFVRCAKSLILAGEDIADGFDKALGLPLEVIPLRNPQLLRPGDILPVRILHEGKPLSNVLVHGRNATDPTHPVSTRTDAEGCVEVKLDRHGVWMVSCVQMTETTDHSGLDWQSFWASLTFQIGSSPSAVAQSLP